MRNDVCMYAKTPFLKKTILHPGLCSSVFYKTLEVADGASVWHINILTSKMKADSKVENLVAWVPQSWASFRNL